MSIENEKKAKSGHLNVCIKGLQQIYYGAPGTGKSHIVNKLTEKKKNVIRTTFHPDSDYSTFVGAYKPTMRRSNTEQRIYSFDELKEILSEMKNGGETRPCQKFGAKYYKSLENFHAKETISLVRSCGFTKNMHTELKKGVAVGKYLATEASKEGEIAYAFVPQAFLQAYVEAWKALGKEDEDVYLVIEEINRGNCAQIFGDLFQLLDRRDDGFSEYPIRADRDMQMYLERELADCRDKISDYSENVKNTKNVAWGVELVLPKNLHILATMNTSDQSLFPIDSAFKRRWDWKYVPINNAGMDWKIVLKIAKKEEGENKDYKIIYDWWEFLEKINSKIGEMTDSQDKKLGYFFAKATGNVIDAETLVNKVFFYLWNDVFKDFGFEDDIFKETFDQFYDTNSDVNQDNVMTLLDKFGLKHTEMPYDSGDDDSSEEKGKTKNDKSTLEVELPGKGKINQTVATEVFTEAFRWLLEKYGYDRIKNWAESYVFKSKDEDDYKEVTVNDEKYYINASGSNNKIKETVLNRIKTKLNIDMNVYRRDSNGELIKE